ncbi:hypothetical protein BKN38_02345 [Helicobacter sp. CLO-3]|uniref:hypothetical protein n=1 Tax=unclassified Helicobacter TaxID=2593540 RepID=UPI000805BA99|nr:MULTISPECIES: hypothetical protein [unclassified Helicobacter]OBV29451.1 hypothetical protein BA723_00685 [Helicobacter sp. CLO-3]OHU84652.1 hypothetical protein BKN38_02345 [Helicobacter sp. CLO-3]
MDFGLCDVIARFGAMEQMLKNQHFWDFCGLDEKRFSSRLDALVCLALKVAPKLSAQITPSTTTEPPAAPAALAIFAKMCEVFDALCVWYESPNFSEFPTNSELYHKIGYLLHLSHAHFAPIFKQYQKKKDDKRGFLYWLDSRLFASICAPAKSHKMAQNSPSYDEINAYIMGLCYGKDDARIYRVLLLGNILNIVDSGGAQRFDFGAFRRGAFAPTRINPPISLLQTRAASLASAQKMDTKKSDAKKSDAHKKDFLMSDSMKRFLHILYKYGDGFLEAKDIAYMRDRRIYYADEKRRLPNAKSREVLAQIGKMLQKRLAEVYMPKPRSSQTVPKTTLKSAAWHDSLPNLCLLSSAQKRRLEDQPLSVKARAMFEELADGMPILPSALDIIKSGFESALWSEGAGERYAHKICFAITELGGSRWMFRRVHHRPKSTAEYQRYQKMTQYRPF